MTKNEYVPRSGKRHFFAVAIRLLGLTLMIEGIGIWLMSFGEPLVKFMAVFIFLSGQCGFMLPKTASWHIVFDMYDLKHYKKHKTGRFVEKKLKQLVKKPAKKKKPAKSKKKK